MYSEDLLVVDEELVVESAVEENEQVVSDKVLTIGEPELGVVVGCLKLNVRSEPNINGAILYEAPANSELLIDLDSSTEDWYNVCNHAGIVGYCMKKYISIEH